MNKKNWSVILAVPIITFLLACAAAPKTVGNAAPSASVSKVQVVYSPSAPDVVMGPSPTPTTATTPPPPPVVGPLTQFSDGQYEVGVTGGTIQAGKYKTSVPESSWGCYWERLKDFDSAFTSIIANDIVSPGTQAIVVIKSSDKGFKSSGCGTWHLS
jgi:hypothetical protein